MANNVSEPRETGYTVQGRVKYIKKHNDSFLFDPNVAVEQWAPWLTGNIFNQFPWGQFTKLEFSASTSLLEKNSKKRFIYFKLWQWTRAYFVLYTFYHKFPISNHKVIFLLMDGTIHSGSIKRKENTSSHLLGSAGLQILPDIFISSRLLRSRKDQRISNICSREGFANW